MSCIVWRGGVARQPTLEAMVAAAKAVVPALTAEQVQAKVQAGEPFVILDVREKTNTTRVILPRPGCCRADCWNFASMTSYPINLLTLSCIDAVIAGLPWQGRHCNIGLPECGLHGGWFHGLERTRVARATFVGQCTGPYGEGMSRVDFLRDVGQRGVWALVRLSITFPGLPWLWPQYWPYCLSGIRRIISISDLTECPGVSERSVYPAL